MSDYHGVCSTDVKGILCVIFPLKVSQSKGLLGLLCKSEVTSKTAIQLKLVFKYLYIETNQKWRGNSN